MFKNILITGGCGFLGQYLVRDLLNEFSDLKIKVLDLTQNPCPIFDFSNTPNLEILLDKDICDRNSIKNDFKNVDMVIHLAGLVSYSLKDKNLLQRVNIQGTKNILDITYSNNIKNLLHISSSTALGFSNKNNPYVDENFKFDWNIAKKRSKYYMQSKHFADLEVERYRRKGLNAMIIYPSAMFGPGDSTNSSRIIRGMYDGKIKFNMPGGHCVIDVRDVSRGIITILRKGITKEKYLLSGYNLTYKEINKIIADELLLKNPKLTIPRILNSVVFYTFFVVESFSKKRLEVAADNIDSTFRFRYFDNSKAKRELGWEPEISFQQTVKDTIHWMAKNGHLGE